MPFYWIGILIALLSGTSNNFGIVLEKKALNKLPEGKKVGRHLLKNPLWLAGFIFNIVLTTFLGFTAQLLIGPTLVPGLEATGMIILAIGSLKFLKEDIKIQEVMGIILMITLYLSANYQSILLPII
jgi:hypothetical protein